MRTVVLLSIGLIVLLSLGCLEQKEIAGQKETNQETVPVANPAPDMPSESEIKKALGEVKCSPMNASHIKTTISGWVIEINGQIEYSGRISDYSDLRIIKSRIDKCKEELAYLKEKGVEGLLINASTMTVIGRLGKSQIAGDANENKYTIYGQNLYVSHDHDRMYEPDFKNFEDAGNNITVQRQLLACPKGSRYRVAYECGREEIKNQTIEGLNSYLMQHDYKLRF